MSYYFDKRKWFITFITLRTFYFSSWWSINGTSTYTYRRQGTWTDLMFSLIACVKLMHILTLLFFFSHINVQHAIWSSRLQEIWKRIWNCTSVLENSHVICATKLTQELTLWRGTSFHFTKIRGFINATFVAKVSKATFETIWGLMQKTVKRNLLVVANVELDSINDLNWQFTWE